jgi:hypothetical protein
MSDDLVEAVEAALVPSSEYEELKPVRQQCVHPGCDKFARRSDGRCNLHSGFRVRAGQRVKMSAEAMALDSDFYRREHKKATKIAASKGDARPAEFALQHLGVVKPIEQKGPQGGVIVQVGVVLPGLKEGV